jgi:hypothetical protein
MEKSKLTENKVKSMLIIFSDTKAIVHKEFVLIGQTIDSAYYCDVLGECMKILEDFAPNFGDKGTGCCITTTHSLTLTFTPGNF